MQFFDIMAKANWHIFQVLTKRSSIMRNYIANRYAGGAAPSHIWLGVSVEDAAHKSRINHRKDINSEARFISFEPLLGSVGSVDLRQIAWAIVGGESEPGARPMKPAWATEIRVACERDGVAFFFKQWGGARPKSLLPLVPAAQDVGLGHLRRRACSGNVLACRAAGNMTVRSPAPSSRRGFPMTPPARCIWRTDAGRTASSARAAGAPRAGR